MSYKPRKTIKKPGALAKNKANPYSRYWRNRADRFWRLIVGIDGKCLFHDLGDCSTKLDAHHLIPREYHPTRCEPMNGVLLCYTHHKLSKDYSAHKSSIRFADLLRIFDKNKYDFCIELEFNKEYNNKEHRMNWKDVSINLEKLWMEINQI